MTKYSILIVSLLMISYFLTTAQEQTSKRKYLHPDLKQVWQSKQELEIPESVIYSTAHQVLFVANIKGSPLDKDGNGYISKMDLKGNVLVKKWVTGLHAPKGMAIKGNLLYVSDIDRLAEIDIKKGKVIRYYEAPHAVFLNDVTNDPENDLVFVSDVQKQEIYQLKNGKFSVWLNDSQLARVNGLFFQKGFLYAGTSNTILKIDPKTKLINMIVNNTGGIDGLEADAYGNWIFSDWRGNVYRSKDGKIEKILSTAALNINAADIDFIPSKDLLLVPTFYGNSIAAYKLTPKD